jgi:hypothetical protein
LLLDQVHFYITHLYGNIKKRQVDKGACTSSTKLLHYAVPAHFEFIKATCPSKNLIMFLFDPPLSRPPKGGGGGGEVHCVRLVEWPRPMRGLQPLGTIGGPQPFWTHPPPPWGGATPAALRAATPPAEGGRGDVPASSRETGPLPKVGAHFLEDDQGLYLLSASLTPPPLVAEGASPKPPPRGGQRRPGFKV